MRDFDTQFDSDIKKSATRFTNYNPNHGSFMKLLDHFNLNVKTNYEHTLFNILDKLKKSKRISEEEGEWLFSHGNANYLNDSVKRTYYLVEAIHQEQEFDLNHEYALLLDASKNFNKANLPERTIDLFQRNKEFVSQIDAPSFKSIYYLIEANSYVSMLNVDAACASANAAYQLDRNSKEVCLLMAKVSLMRLNAEEFVKYESEALENKGSQSEIQEAAKQGIKSILSQKNRLELIKDLFSINQSAYRYLRVFLPKKIQSCC